MRVRPTPSGRLAAGLAIALSCLAAAGLPAQWLPHGQLSTAMQGLASRHAGRAQLVTIATSPGGRAVQALRLGAGADVATRPAVLVIANAHGPHLVGSQIAQATAERLLEGYGSDPATKALLDTRTLWFVPRLNPDAAEAFFGAVKGERTANGAAYDDDRDQRVDEDGPDDLNGDGLITVMRIADPNGEWIADESEPGLMRRADPAKGEVGRFRIVVEGKDDDGDGRYNEDGPGGTDINRNFAHNYAHHGAEAGAHPASAPETRGLLEFLAEHPEIAAVYVLGPQDNLMTPWTFRAATGIAGAAVGTSAGGPLPSILRPDETIFADISRRLLATSGLTKGPATSAGAGDLLSHLYYVWGRWAIGSRGWWAPEAPRDTTARGRGTAGGPDPLAEERNLVRWYRANGVEALVPWTKVTVPGEKAGVEVGGMKPYLALNPPAGAQLDSSVARQRRAITELAGMLPKLALRDVEVTAVGTGVWRVSADVANDGTLPTMSAIGGRLRNPRGIRLELDLKGATLLNGAKIEIVGAVAGGGRSTRRTWTLAAPAGTVLTLTATSPVTGSASQTITLR